MNVKLDRICPEVPNAGGNKKASFFYEGEEFINEAACTCRKVVYCDQFGKAVHRFLLNL